MGRKRWPIGLKIILPLAAIQVAIAAGGISLLASILYEIRLRELDDLLKAQSDAIESGMIWDGAKATVPKESELFRLLQRDATRFVRILGKNGELLYQSSGPSEQVRSALSAAFTKVPSNEEVIAFAEEGRRWRLIYEDMELPTEEHQFSGITLLNATDITGPLAKLQQLINILIAAGVATALLSSLCTIVVVSISTKNLRKLSDHLVNINPDDPHWGFPHPPQSREEEQLFAAFATILQRIRKVQKDQKIFIANASHELKTPVAGILAALEVILSRPRSAEDYRATCRDILAVTRDMERLTSALLHIARLDEQGAPQLGIVVVNEICLRLLQRWQHAARSHGVSLHAVNCDKELTCLGQREFLEIVIGNLLDNAIKYAHPGGSVTLTLDGGLNRPVLIRIQDQGIGMRSDQLERLGTAFYRADDSRSDRGSFGLGYAHALQFVRAMGGTIHVTSVFGEGSEFVVELPAID